jgi:hypothetical protein
VTESLILIAPESKAWRQGIPNELRATCRVILHFLYSRSLHESNAHGWVALNREILEKFVHSKLLTRAFTALIDSGVIQRSGSYQTGIRSKECQISPRFRATVTRICHDSATAKRFKRVFDKRGEPLQDHHRQMSDDLNNQFSIDIDAVRHIANCEPDPGNTKRLIQAGQMIHTLLESGSARVLVDSFGHRFHSPLTCIPKVLHDAMRIKGEPVTKRDVSSSQPRIASALLHKVLSDEELGIRSAETAGIPLPPLSIMSGKRTELSAEIDEFCRLTATGAFNSTFILPGWDVTEAKTGLFAQTFFGRFTGYGPYGSRFQEMFPLLTAWIGQIKRGDYKRLCRTLQRLESSIMIDGVAKRLCDEGVLFYTVHDAIHCRAADVARVDQLIREEFARIGAEVTIK